MWREIKKIIHHNHHFLITTHEHPDGDGIGSACALIELLRHLGKEAKFIVDSAIAERFQFLNFHNCFYEYDSNLDVSNAQVFIILDTHRLERIGRVAKYLQRSTLIPICIDHHLPSSTFTPNSVIDTRACSVGAMIYTLYKEIGFPLTLEAATGIYTSVISDTGRFSYASTSRKAHKLADECIKLGVDPELMHQRLFQQIPLNTINILAEALATREFFFNEQLMIQTLVYHHEDPSSNLMDMDFLHEFNKMFKGLKCVVLLRELQDGRVRISLRSSIGGPNVEEIAKQIGGGGHSKAAGATLQLSLAAAKQLALDYLKNKLV
ncbi:MAG: DHH family phosphoesterase [Parachlamydiales bacterium]|nr:DHH family phosphoesterase [Parachlamydiales bacterium]